MGVSSWNGGDANTNPGGAGEGEVCDGVVIIGASNTPSALGILSECSTSWGPNAVNLQLPQGPIGLLAPVWSAGFKDISDSPEYPWVWQYMQPFGARVDAEIMMGPSLTLGRRLSDEGKAPAVLEYGVGGLAAYEAANHSTRIWQSLAKNYERFFGTINVKTILLMLGGNDAGVELWADNFEASLESVAAQARALPMAGIATARVFVPFRTDVTLSQLYGAEVLAGGAAYTSNPANNAEALDLDPLWPNDPAWQVGLHFTTQALQVYGDAAGAAMLPFMTP